MRLPRMPLRLCWSTSSSSVFRNNLSAAKVTNSRELDWMIAKSAWIRGKNMGINDCWISDLWRSWILSWHSSPGMAISGRGSGSVRYDITMRNTSSFLSEYLPSFCINLIFILTSQNIYSKIGRICNNLVTYRAWEETFSRQLLTPTVERSLVY